MKEEEIFDYVMCLSEEQINEKLAELLKEKPHNYCSDYEQTHRFLKMFSDEGFEIDISKMGAGFDWQVEIEDTSDFTDSKSNFYTCYKEDTLGIAVAKCLLDLLLFGLRD